MLSRDSEPSLSQTINSKTAFMNINRIFSLIRASLLALVLGASSTVLGGDAPGASEAFSIDALYAIPSLIGTEPGGVDWSGDGQQLAFLWNDKGGFFRDIWLYDTASGKKRQLTHHASGADAALEHRGSGELRWQTSQFRGREPRG